jgi:hypothetical protein
MEIMAQGYGKSIGGIEMSRVKGHIENLLAHDTDLLLGGRPVAGNRRLGLSRGIFIYGNPRICGSS